jgi:hypothetical protein
MITFKKIWEDPDLVELQVSAAHDGFAGLTRAYFTVEIIAELAEDLRRFGDMTAESYAYETPCRAITIKLRQLDRLGHMELAVGLFDKDSGQHVTVCIPVTPVELDHLAGQLSGIAGGVRRLASICEAVT